MAAWVVGGVVRGGDDGNGGMYGCMPTPLCGHSHDVKSKQATVSLATGVTMTGGVTRVWCSNGKLPVLLVVVVLRCWSVVRGEVS